MKQLTKFLTLSALVLFTATPALAVENKPTPFAKPLIRRDYRQTVRQIKVDTREDIKTIRADAKVTMTQTRLEANRKRTMAVETGLYNAFTKRLDALKSYQTRIQTRLDAKLVKLPGNQKLMDAQAKLTNSTNTLIPKFTTDLAAFKTQLDAISSSADPKSLVPQLKTFAKTVEQDLKAIRAELVAALRLIVQAK